MRDVDRKVSYLPKKQYFAGDSSRGERDMRSDVTTICLHTHLLFSMKSKLQEHTAHTRQAPNTAQTVLCQEAMLKEGKQREIQLEMNLEEVRREPQQKSYSRLFNTVEHLLWSGLHFSRWCRTSVVKSMEL